MHPELKEMIDAGTAKQSPQGYVYQVVETNILNIEPGMTVETSDGHHKTVSAGSTKHHPLTGANLFGDSYHGGRLPVKRVLIAKATQNGIIWQ